jgi:hypothetical protein
VRISWAANTEAELSGYVVYRSLAPNGPWSERVKKVRRNELFCVDKSAKRGTKYYYLVRAANERDAESSPSDVVSATGS